MQQLPPPPPHNQPPTPKNEPNPENQVNPHGALPTIGMILPIAGGSLMEFQTKKQKKDHLCLVNNVGVQGPAKYTDWSRVPITFTEDLQLESYPHTDEMVIKTNIAAWEISRVLIDTGSSADIIFANTFDQMKLSRNQLQPSESPLIGFGGKHIQALGKISLPVSFGTQANARTEYITFDVVDLYYPYNAILGGGFTTRFNAARHMAYLCMKIPALHGIITVRGSQKEARNIEKAIYRAQRNINAVESTDKESEPPDMPRGKTDMAGQEETKVTPLEKELPDRKVTISSELSKAEEEELMETLVKNKDIFVWSASELQGVSRDIIQHELDINENMRPRKQKQRKMSEDRILAAKVEVQRLLDAKVIREVKYSEWLANVVLVPKKNGKMRTCIDFTDLNKACKKDPFPLPRIDASVDKAARCQRFSLLDCFSGYHQIWMKKDEDKTSFTTPFRTYCYTRMPEGLKNVGATFARMTKEFWLIAR
jgi:hypothetical protein